MGIYVAAFEAVAYGGVGDAVVDVAQKEFLFSHKLVTWIQLSGRRDCYVFSSDAAA